MTERELEELRNTGKRIMMKKYEKRKKIDERKRNIRDWEKV